ncbi:FGF [Alphabaculovirus myunipunctae]|uniref:FGF n=1 Tax=Mythimna unipuncta nucleopolyhedrovirus TaxID=447897 RepID=A0A2K9VS52_9ABAC|nr:FGF [Mythimna unipuncta nucleopolyhedrovirus]AUV65284.1 FGF [Mythimna unipuncta nucleopolyhedrovirus]
MLAFIVLAVLAVDAAARPAAGPITEGTRNHVHIFINHHYVNMNANGTIDAVQLAESNSTIWHRIAINDTILLRSSVHCTYMCINECGYTYTAKVPNHECLWYERYDDANYRFIYKKFDNRTAYLAVNIAGKLKRVVLLRRETLQDNIDSAHVTIQAITAPLTYECQATNTTKLLFRPVKTCKNPPRHHHKKPRREAESMLKYENLTMSLNETTTTTTSNETIYVFNKNDTVEENETVDENIIDNKIIGKVGVGVNNISELNNISEHHINKVLQNNEVPIMGPSSASSSESLSKNFTEGVNNRTYYHTEELSIQLLDDGDEHKKIEDGIEKIIDRLLTAHGNSSDASDRPPVFLMYKKSITLTQCRLL